MLKNEMYLGNTVYGKGINLSYKSKKVKQIPRSEWKKYENTHKAIISKELFDSVQKRMKLNQRAKSHTHNWILNGIIYCKECGEPMQLKVKYRRDGKTISFMRLYCSSSLHKKGYCIRKYKGIELQSVTQIVVSNLNKKVSNLINCEDITELLERLYKNRDIKAIKSELELKQNKLAKVNKMITSLYSDYKGGILQEYDFNSMYKQELEKRARLNEEIKKLNNKINNQTVISESEYKRVVKKVSDVKKWSKEQIADIIDNVQVDNEDNIYINYKYAIMEMA